MLKFDHRRGPNSLADAVLPPRAHFFIRRAGVIMKVAMLSSMWALASIAAPAAAQAVAVHYQLNIPRQQLDGALKDLGEQTGLQIARFTDIQGAGPLVGPVRGDMPVTVALKILLASSDLTFKFVNDHTIAVLSSSAADEQIPTMDSTQAPSSTTDTVDEMQSGESKRKSFLVSQANHDVFPAAPGLKYTAQDSAANPGSSSQLDEIIVTAQKKLERLLDTPVPVTVVDAQSLATSGAGRIQDFYATVPGLSLSSTPGGSGTQYITLRGLSTSSQATPGVAVVIDDVPFGLSTGANSGAFGVPDLDPSSLERIEVLKGPQGTLYGADSLGGVIKYVTKEPSSTDFSGNLQTLAEGIPGHGVGYAERGSLNVPVSSTFAVSTSAFSRQDPGYVENVVTKQQDVNVATSYGGRLATLWKPDNDFSLKLSALYQTTHGDGGSTVDANGLFQPALGDLQQSIDPGAGSYDDTAQLYSATVNANVGPFRIASITGYGVYEWSNVLGDSAYTEGSVGPFFPTATGYLVPNDSLTHNFSQELRLASTLGDRVDWLVGIFFEHQKNQFGESILADDVQTAAVLGSAAFLRSGITLSQEAVFGDATVHLTDRFDVQFGARESWDRQTYTDLVTGDWASAFYGAEPNSPYSPPSVTSNSSAPTYLVTPKYKLSDDAMVYGRVATGYQIGGPNYLTPGAKNAPTDYGPSYTINYELGTKAAFLDHALVVDASVYHIEWRDIQVQVYDPNCGLEGCYYFTNADHAKSDGVELAIEGHPRQGTTLSFSGSSNRAVLTEDLPPAAIAAGAYGLAGFRLPYSVRASADAGIDQALVHWNSGNALVGANFVYVGPRPGEFAYGASVPRLQFPSYTTLNLHLAARYQKWALNLFANNATDRRGILGGQYSASMFNTAGYDASVIQPRTIGLSVSTEF